MKARQLIDGASYGPEELKVIEQAFDDARQLWGRPRNPRKRTHQIGKGRAVGSGMLAATQVNRVHRGEERRIALPAPRTRLQSRTPQTLPSTVGGHPVRLQISGRLTNARYEG
jgi:hypothetical protein